ncbi:GAF domain-containing protein [Hyalangium versicolor]|uniref:GAF domain-containing protein n=1 Tax=Hyalangium versicolor TaxID=2861190 RepID=UPI001CCA7958|nr:GAF domain-containing protein [Hyalangium versicolor]
MIEAFSKISEASKLLMESGFTPATVATALSQVGTAMGVDRVTLFENQPFPIRGRMLADARYAWSSQGTTAHSDLAVTKQISLRELAPLWAESLAQGQTVSCVLAAAPPRMKLLLTETKTQSLLMAPIQVSKEKWGFVTLEDCHRPRVWTAEETTLLKALAGGLGTALRHRQMRSSLSQTRTQLAEMMALAGTR